MELKIREIVDKSEKEQISEEILNNLSMIENEFK